MATYAIQVPQDRLSDEHKAALHAAVKGAHARVTGAPWDRTQVTVAEIFSGCFYMHGRLLECDHVFVHGFVAGDAAHSVAAALRTEVASAVASAADFELECVLVTISEVPTDRMMPVDTQSPMPEQSW